MDATLALFEHYGHLNLGEDISQLQHALQCAQAAAQDQAPEHLIVAALLHDIGHLVIYRDTHAHPEDQHINGYHEKVGALFVAQHFIDEVVKPIRLHVAAKRYQCSVDPIYRQSLSAASWRSLELQGGEMDKSTCQVFESSPWFDDALRLRQYDEKGKALSKTIGLELEPLSHYYELLVQYTRTLQRTSISIN